MTDGGILLLCAQSPFFNTIHEVDRPVKFSWYCIGKGKVGDLCQIVVYPVSQETEVDNMFLLCNEKMTKKYHNDVVIYSHNSLDEKGIYRSGVTFNHITIQPIFSAGILIDNNVKSMIFRRDAKRHVEWVMANPKFKWNMITPNDLFENCFDGYSFVRLHGLQHLTVKFNELCWLDLGPTELMYLSLAGQRYFPFFIQPSRIDRVTFSVKWDQTANMIDTNDYIRIYDSDDPKKMLKYFFNNQRPCSVLAAYDYWLYDTAGNPFQRISIRMGSVVNAHVETWIKTFKQAVVTIQRWWIKICYNPRHPVGNRLITLQYNRLIS